MKENENGIHPYIQLEYSVIQTLEDSLHFQENGAFAEKLSTWKNDFLRNTVIMSPRDVDAPFLRKILLPLTEEFSVNNEYSEVSVEILDGIRFLTDYGTLTSKWGRKEILRVIDFLGSKRFLVDLVNVHSDFDYFQYDVEKLYDLIIETEYSEKEESVENTVTLDELSKMPVEWLLSISETIGDGIVDTAISRLGKV